LELLARCVPAETGQGETGQGETGQGAHAAAYGRYAAAYGRYAAAYAKLKAQAVVEAARQAEALRYQTERWRKIEEESYAAGMAAQRAREVRVAGLLRVDCCVWTAACGLLRVRAALVVSSLASCTHTHTHTHLHTRKHVQAAETARLQRKAEAQAQTQAKTEVPLEVPLEAGDVISYVTLHVVLLLVLPHSRHWSLAPARAHD
jgi:hypothetical protein